MVRIEFHPPDMNPMVRKVMQNLKLRMTFLKNWANSAAMDARGNARAKGGRRYWKDLARSIQVRRLSETAVVVSSSQIGAALKQYGGIVRPVTARALTIPITDEAKGKTAYEFERPDRPLFVVSEKTGDPGTIGVLGYAKKTRKIYNPLCSVRITTAVIVDPIIVRNNYVQRISRFKSDLIHTAIQFVKTVERTDQNSDLLG